MTAIERPVIDEGEAIAREALSRFDFSPSTTLEVIGRGANVTLLVDDPVNRERAAMRVHRADHHTKIQIQSELVWLDALRADRCVDVPPPISSRRGERVVVIDLGDGPRFVTVCGWLEGVALDGASELVGAFRMLGAATARLHAHAARWELPPGFCRRPWSMDRLLGPESSFGSWRDGLGIGAGERALLARAEFEVRRAAAGFATGPGESGLVHGDLRLANLLMHERDGREILRVVDFDACGHSWLMYDFAAAVDRMEHDPRLPELIAAWTTGYRTVRPLSAEQEGQLATFVMLRRLSSVGWVGRNAATSTEAATLGAGFTAGACEVAEQYLGGSLGGA